MKKFLLVSDDVSKQAQIREILEQAGNYQLTIADSPKTAREQIENGTWDVIFLDYYLITATGMDTTIELTRLARTKFPQAKMTAFSIEPGFFRLQREAGCDHELDPGTHPALLPRLVLQYS